MKEMGFFPKVSVDICFLWMTIFLHFSKQRGCMTLPLGTWEAHCQLWKCLFSVD